MAPRAQQRQKSIVFNYFKGFYTMPSRVYRLFFEPKEIGPTIVLIEKVTLYAERNRFAYRRIFS
jgi:hypothetical protein